MLYDYGMDVDELIAREQATAKAVQAQAQAKSSANPLASLIDMNSEWGRWLIFGLVAAASMGLAYRFIR